MALKEREWQAMDRKRLMVGDKFRYADTSPYEQIFEVMEEYQDLDLYVLTQQGNKGTVVRGKPKGAKVLKLFAHNGIWECWMDMETGECFRDFNKTYECGNVPVKIFLDITPPVIQQGQDNVAF